MSDEDKEVLVEFFKKYIFKKTSRSNVKKILNVVHIMIKNKVKKLSPAHLAKIVTYADKRDLLRLVDFLVGKRKSKFSKAAKSGAKAKADEGAWEAANDNEIEELSKTA